MLFRIRDILVLFLWSRQCRSSAMARAVYLGNQANSSSTRANYFSAVCSQFCWHFQNENYRLAMLSLPSVKSDPSSASTISAKPDLLGAAYQLLILRANNLDCRRTSRRRRDRAYFCSGGIRVLDPSGDVERVIPFDDANRKL